MTKTLSSAISTSHFQAKPISWSMRTRGSVPRIQTKMKAKVNALTMNQNRPTTTSNDRNAQITTTPMAKTLKSRKATIERLQEATSCS